MPTALAISRDQARRFLVRRHLLDPPRALPAEPASVLRVVDRLGSLQFDPLEVPGARSHDLVLHARIAGYRREWCESLLYAPAGERRLIELYNKSLNILPIEELPFYRVAWQRSGTRYMDFLETHRELAETIVERIRTDGELSTQAFRHVPDRVDWWWAETPAARAVMEALFVSGRLGIARRDGNRRFYDLIERLVPEDLLARHAPEDEQVRHRLLSRHRGVGLMAVGGAGELIMGTGSTADRARTTASLVDSGILLPVAVEGIRETRHILADELPILEAAAVAGGSGAASASRASGASVTFLAPLDPFLWDRRLTSRLFDFEYIWEVYVPGHKRRHGYYVLPILYGDRLIGRIEPRYERTTRSLHILGIWFEEGTAPMADPEFMAALGAALQDYRAFVGAKTISWPRTRPGRDLAGALRRTDGAG